MQVYDMPDERGHFGPYGGIFVAETLIEALDELRAMYERYRNDPEFLAEFEHDLKYFVGRPSPISIPTTVRRSSAISRSACQR